MPHPRFGKYGKHIELFEMFKSWERDPKAQSALAVEEGWIQESQVESYEETLREEISQLEEGTGTPEGRADFPLFLLATTRHRLRQGFRRRASQWRRYVGVERAEDFRVHTVSQLNGLTGMGPVPEFDEYPRLRSSEEMGPPFSVGKHGGIYGVTFEMIVNDDANTILNRTPTEMGRMAAAYMAQVIAALVEVNPNWIDGLPFFSTTARQGLPLGNEYTGAAAEPSEDNLVTWVSDLRNAEDEMGFPMDVDPGTVITKDERAKHTFRRIIRSQQTGATANDTGSDVFDKGTYNAASDLLAEDAVMVEPYLKDPNDIILLAEVGRPAFVTAFLRDMTEPQIWVHDSGMRGVNGAGRDPYLLWIDEILMKIRSIFGVALGDPRAARRARRA